MFPLPIFPTNGFDTSILTPVLVGMGFLSLFSETLGWPFVGLVVPGYLAAVGIAAPLSAITILAESFATFLLSRVVGLWIPETNSWTVFFGRERFFLLIMSSVIVRLASEGFVLPYVASEFGFAFASELYSIGLVLVPLVANAFWNIGFIRGVWQMGVVAVCTIATCKWVLLPLTNLSLSRFELTYESVALDFLASSKSYVILLTGTALAARANVRFGWDYNGILVPGLLTVAWYSPVKLVSTFIEAFVVAWLAKKLVATPLFQRALIEGPRRTVLVFLVGYAVKYLEGVLFLFLLPGEEITDFYGFGYVLPSLLAVKVWVKGSPGKVLMPAFQVSLVGFIMGNLLGYAFSLALPYTEARSEAPTVSVEKAEPLAAQALMHVGGSLRETDDPDTRMGRAVVLLAASARGRGRSLDFALRAVEGEQLRVMEAPRLAGGDWWSVRRAADGRRGVALPLVAVTRVRNASGVLSARLRENGEGAAEAVAAANALGAAALVVFGPSVDEDVRAAWEHAIVVATEQPLVLRVSADRSGAVRLEPTEKPIDEGKLRRGLGLGPDAPLLLGVPEQDELWARALPGVGAELLAQSAEPQAPTLPWNEAARAFALAKKPLPRPLDADAQRAFATAVAPQVVAWAADETRSVTPALRHAAGAFGLRVREERVAADAEQGAPVSARAGRLVLEPAHDAAADLLWIAERGGASFVVSSPDARVRGVAEAAHFLHHELRAAHVILARRPQAGSPFLLAHRALLAKGQRVVEVRPILQAMRAVDVSLVLTAGDVVTSGQGEPAWAPQLTPAWQGLGLVPVWYDARPEFWSLRGSSDAVVSIAHGEGKRDVILAWLKPEFLSLLAAPPVGEDEEVLLREAGWIIERASLTSVVRELETAPMVPCDWSELTLALSRFRYTKNPFALGTALRTGCAPRLVRDEASTRLFVVGRPGPNPVASRFDGLGHKVVAQSAEEFTRAALGGAGHVELALGAGEVPGRRVTE